MLIGYPVAYAYFATNSFRYDILSEKIPMKWLLSLTVACCFASGFGFAQDVDPWQKKKADSFRPLTDAQKAAIENAVPAQAVATPKKERRILMFYRCEGFIHGSIDRKSVV